MPRSPFHAPLATLLSATLMLPASVLAAPPPAGSGAAAPDPGMSDEDRKAYAKQLYGEGAAALEAGDPASALGKFEEAYNTYAPDLHIFNYNIGQAAFELGDCVKAKTSYQRFLDLVPEHNLRGDAQTKLLEIERSGCASTTTTPVPTPTTTTTTTPTTPTGPTEIDSEDAPVLESRKSEREDAIQEEIRETDSKKASPMLIAGAVLTGVGVLGLIGGAVSVGLANKKATDLAGLASPGPTGFPNGNYSDDEVFQLDRNGLPSNNAATVVLFVAGGVLTAVGVTLIALDLKKKKGRKKASDKNAASGSERSASVRRPKLTAVGPAILPGGAGASAAIRF